MRDILSAIQIVWIIFSLIQPGDPTEVKSLVWRYCTLLLRYNGAFVQAALHFDSVIVQCLAGMQIVHSTEFGQNPTKVQHLSLVWILNQLGHTHKVTHPSVTPEKLF